MNHEIMFSGSTSIVVATRSKIPIMVFWIVTQEHVVERPTEVDYMDKGQEYVLRTLKFITSERSERTHENNQTNMAMGNMHDFVRQFSQL